MALFKTETCRYEVYLAVKEEMKREYEDEIRRLRRKIEELTVYALIYDKLTIKAEIK